MAIKIKLLCITILSVLIVSGCGESDSSVSISDNPEAYKLIDSQGNIIKNIAPPGDLTEYEITVSSSDYSCGSSALATILNYSYEMSLSEEDVIEGLLTYGNREQIEEHRAFSLLDMKMYVTALGYAGFGYSYDSLCTLQDFQNENVEHVIDKSLLPIQIGDFKHFVVLAGFDDNYVYLADPSIGRLCLSYEDFCDALYQNMIFVVWAEDDGLPLKKSAKIQPLF